MLHLKGDHLKVYFHLFIYFLQSGTLAGCNPRENRLFGPRLSHSHFSLFEYYIDNFAIIILILIYKYYSEYFFFILSYLIYFYLRFNFFKNILL